MVLGVRPPPRPEPCIRYNGSRALTNGSPPVGNRSSRPTLGDEDADPGSDRLRGEGGGKDTGSTDSGPVSGPHPPV